MGFDGSSVKQVLDDMSDQHTAGAPIKDGPFAACLREANFNKLLLEAQSKAAMQKLIGHGEKTTVTTREKLTTEDGRGFIRVKMTTYWWDGRIEDDVVMKERHRL